MGATIIPKHKCSICGKKKEIYKTTSVGVKEYYYCKKCWGKKYD